MPEHIGHASGSYEVFHERKNGDRDCLTHRALQLDEWGSHDDVRFVDRPRPAPLPSEVLVKVEAVGLNPIDRLTIEGRGYMNAVDLPSFVDWTSRVSS